MLINTNMYLSVKIVEIDRYPQAKVYNSAGTLVATKDLVHVASWLYTDTTYIPTAKWEYSVIYTIYTDAPHTVLDTTYDSYQDVITVEDWADFKQSISGISSQVVSDMLVVADSFKANVSWLSTVTTSDIVTWMQAIKTDFRNTTAEIENAVWNATLASHVASGSTGERLDQLESIGWPWAIAYDIQITDWVNPIPAVPVWITTDIAGTNTIAGAKNTNGTWHVIFYLQAWTYYAWAADDNTSFVNPTLITVS